MSKKMRLDELKERNVTIGEDSFGNDKQDSAFGISQNDSIERAFPNLEKEREENDMEKEIKERENIANNDYKEFSGIPLGDINDVTNIAKSSFDPKPVNNIFRDMILDKDVTSFVYKITLESVMEYVASIVTIKDAKVNIFETNPADFMRRMSGVVFGDTLKYFFPSANNMAKRGVFFRSMLAVECNVDDVANDSRGKEEKYNNFLEEAMAQNPDAVYNINNADIIFGVQVPKCIMTDYRTGKLIFFVNTLSVILGSLNVNMALIKNMSITVAETSDKHLHIFVNKK